MKSDLASGLPRHQRSEGSLAASFGPQGLLRLREQGALKLRQPPGSREAIMINTAGGIAEGDRLNISARIEPGTSLTLTSQASERVYRSLGRAGEVDIAITVGDGARLLWLPHETILYEHSALRRRMTINLAGTAELVLLETLVLGRAEMGETADHLQLDERRDISRDGRLLHAERVRLDGQVPRGLATLRNARAIATLIVIGPRAADLLAPVRDALAGVGAASFWTGKLVARAMATDAFALRKAMTRLLTTIVAAQDVPRTWAM